MTRPCPLAETLSAWLDDELSGVESETVRNHLEECSACRGQVLGWVQAVAETGLKDSMVRCLPNALSPRLFREGRGEDATIPTCLTEEVLVAYSEAELTPAEAACAEQHLRQCAGCVSEVQRLIHLRVAMEKPVGIPAQPQPEAFGVEAPPVRSRSGQGWVANVREWIVFFGRIIAQPWPALGAVAATALLVLVITRLLPGGGGDVGFRGPVSGVQKVEVVADNVIARARPSENEAVVATLGRGTIATELEQSGDWTRIELPDGRRVWVPSTDLSGVRATE